MKIIGLSFVFILLMVNTSQAENEDKHRAIREKCEDQLSLTDAALKDAMDDPKDLGCYLLCFFQELSIMDEKGELDPNAAVNAIEDHLREAAKPVIFNCYEEGQKMSKDKPCDIAYGLVNCFKNQAPTLYNQLGIFQPPVNIKN